MAYSTGTASSPTDLLQKLVAWLVTRGWTQNASLAEGTGWRANVSKNGQFITLRATPGGETLQGYSVISTANQIGIGIFSGTAYASGNGWNAQGGCPVGNGAGYNVGAFMQLPVGAISGYWFLDDGSDNVVVVVERTSGIFTHMGWGPTLAKEGTWTGGNYFFSAFSGYAGGATTNGFGGTASTTAHCPGCHKDAQSTNAAFVRADVDAFTGKWVPIGDLTTAIFGYTGKIGASSVQGHSSNAVPTDVPDCPLGFLARGTSAMNSQTALIPVRWYAQRDGGSGHSLLGRLPNIFASNATSKGFTPGSTVSIGSDTYLVFPNFAVKRVS